MSLKIKCLYREDFKKVFNFLENNFSSPTHYKEWNMVVSKHFKTEFFYFGAFDGNELIGVCPLHRYKINSRMRVVSGPKEFLIPYGGWIFSKGETVKKTYFPIRKNESLEIFSLPLLNEFNTNYKGLKLLKNYETSIIDLEKNEDDIWNGLDQKRRNMIRKAIKNNVEISTLQNEDLKEFYYFYSSANDSYGLESMPFGYFRDLNNMAENINLDIITAKSEKKILGLNVIISNKDFSIYWLGVRKKETENNGFFDLLQWESIKKSKGRKCKYYDLCYVEKERLPNIYKFKTDYSNNFIPVYNLSKRSTFYKILNRVRKITG